MRRQVLGWIGVVWGGLIVLSGGVGIASGEAEDGYGTRQYLTFALGAIMLFAGIRMLRSAGSQPKAATMHGFAERYSAAWCTQNASSVAGFFAKHGSLTINGGTPSVGRPAITAAAQGFMSAFPDMVVTMDGLEEGDGLTKYHWTLTGTNTGPGGSGRPVRISGYELWEIGADGLIVDSQGHFDEAEYQRQLKG